MRREGLGFGDRKLDTPPNWLIGAAAHPHLEPIELNLVRLKKKVAAGVDFVMTQAVTDLAGFTRWMDAVRKAGLDTKVAILAGVEANGGGQMAAKLKSVPGIRGIHILSGGCESSVATVIQEAGLA
jgi:methylenetetrahydrofolate reductase (NADPH)